MVVDAVRLKFSYTGLLAKRFVVPARRVLAVNDARLVNW